MIIITLYSNDDEDEKEEEEKERKKGNWFLYKVEQEQTSLLDE